MPMFFLDSSAIVKRYVAEPGSAWVRALCDDEDSVIILGEITLAEVAAAFSRIVREGRATELERQEFLDLFLGDADQEHELVPIDRPVIDTAVDLTQQHPLRGYDAVQLAAALSINEGLGELGLPSLVFVAADDVLLAAATAEGLDTENPIHYRDQDV
ncbi:MAG: type II toxin-antitoxin system VapC family toxin [Anaerolineae bacterium]